MKGLFEVWYTLEYQYNGVPRFWNSTVIKNFEQSSGCKRRKLSTYTNILLGIAYKIYKAKAVYRLLEKQNLYGKKTG